MKQPSKEDLMKKWAPILGSMGMTGSQLDNLSQLAENQSNHILEENTPTENTSGDFPSLLPLAMKVAATTIGGGMSKEERERIEAEVKSENRDGKIESLIEGTEYVEKKLEEHPDYKPGVDLVPVQPMYAPMGLLFYIDYKYGDNKTYKKTRRSGKKHKKNGSSI